MLVRARVPLLALDPLEGTNLCANGLNDALAVVAMEAKVRGKGALRDTRLNVEIDEAKIELPDAKRKDLQPLDVPPDTMRSATPAMTRFKHFMGLPLHAGAGDYGAGPVRVQPRALRRLLAGVIFQRLAFREHRDDTALRGARVVRREVVPASEYAVPAGSDLVHAPPVLGEYVSRPQAFGGGIVPRPGI